MTVTELILLPAAKATLLLAPALAYALLSRRASAAARHLACFGAVCGALLLPLLTLALPTREIASLRAVPTGDAGPAWLAWVWALGFLVAVARRLRSEVALRRLLCRGRPAADLELLRAADAAAAETGAGRPVRVVVVPGALVPFVAGFLRPVLAVPAEAGGWGASRLRAMFLHELSHVRRRDPLTQAIADLAGAILWFHPLVHLAARRMREEREAACDDPVLARGARPSRYASMLLRTAGRLRAAPAAVAALRTSHPLCRRVGVLLGSERRRGGPGRARAVGLFAAVVLVAATLAPLTPARAATAHRHACGHSHGSAATVSVSAAVSTSSVAR